MTYSKATLEAIRDFFKCHSELCREHSENKIICDINCEICHGDLLLGFHYDSEYVERLIGYVSEYKKTWYKYRNRILMYKDIPESGWVYYKSDINENGDGYYFVKDKGISYLRLCGITEKMLRAEEYGEQWVVFKHEPEGE